MNRFSIKTLENLTGIKAHTLRIWEQRYGIFKPKRTATNIRYYDSGDLKTALRVSLLNGHGYKISRIHKMGEEEIAAAIDSIQDPTFQRAVLVNRLIDATLRMDVETLENLLSLYARRYGIEAMVEELVFQFMEKIGLMWMTDRLLPAQEHLASHVIMRKIAVAQEGLPPAQNRHPGILLFLPEDEMHELGLCYVHYLLRKWDKGPIYLGANAPLAEVKAVYEVRKPPYIYVHLTLSAAQFDAARYLRTLCAAVPSATVLASGALLTRTALPKIGNLRPLYSLEESRMALSGL